MTGTAAGNDDSGNAAADPHASQTDWSLIMRAAATPLPDSSDALEQVTRRYWPAIFAFVRALGRDVHEAADLTQGFVCDVMLERGLLARADPDRGRFRTLLLTSLKNYLAERHRHATRRKRAPSGGSPLQLDPDALARTAIDTAATPDAAFSSQWGVTLVHHVLEHVRHECETDGLAAHWEVFEGRVVRPMLFGEEPAEYDQLVRRLDLKDVSQAANMMITIKRRVVRQLVQEVRRTVGDDAEVEDELVDLLRVLERPS